jgi:integrase
MATEKVELTPKRLDNLSPAPKGQRYELADALIKGLRVRVGDEAVERGRYQGKAASISFVLLARFPPSTAPTRRTLGRYERGQLDDGEATVGRGSLTLEAARNLAADWKATIRRGLDPAAEARKELATAEAVPEPETFERVAERFMTQHVKRNKLRSEGEIKRIIDKYFSPKWKAREFTSIRRRDVAELLDEIEERAPVQADRVLAVLSKLCSWYQARDEDYVSPIVRGMRRTRPAERARDRMLSDDEIRLIWKAAGEAGTFGAFVKLALLSAQRRGKVLGLRWADIGRDGVWTIAAEAREKSNAERLKLPAMALEIIKAQPEREDNEFVFAGRAEGPINGMTKDKVRLEAAITKANEGEPIPHWTIHDLRRTAKSLMARAGVRPDISERVLGHAIGGVQGIYDRHQYDREKAEALRKLAALVGRIVNPPKGNVVPLRRAAKA